MTYDSSLKELVRGPKPALFQQYTFYVPAATHTVDILNHIDISKSQWHLFNNYVILYTLKFFKAVAPLLLSCIREMGALRFPYPRRTCTFRYRSFIIP